MRKDIGTFRGKELDTGIWVMGYFDAAGAPSRYGYVYIITENEQTCRVDPETVGEYTGLTDKYGERIFEGDIIKSTRSGTIGKVGYYPEEGAFMVLFNISSGYCVEYLGDINMSTIEIIGNIYDGYDGEL